MQHGIVADQHGEVGSLVWRVEAEPVAVIRDRCADVAHGQRGNGSLEAGNGPTSDTRHALKSRRSSAATPPGGRRACCYRLAGATRRPRHTLLGSLQGSPSSALAVLPRGASGTRRTARRQGRRHPCAPPAWRPALVGGGAEVCSAVKHRPADVVPQALVVKYEVLDGLRKLVALPPALQSSCAVAVAFGCGGACGLDRIGGGAELVRGDVRDARGLPGGVGGMPRCPAQIPGRGLGTAGRLAARVILTSPCTHATACSTA